MKLQKAKREQVKLKIGVSGASGFGKTYSALLMGYGIVGDWSKIAVIDTENNSASLYSDLGDFNTLQLDAPYSPERYIDAIKVCEEAGIELLIIDSISHEWSGSGGCLEILDSLGGRFQDWAKLTPRHNKFIQKILQTNMHVITSTRRKQEYEISKNSKGRNEVNKLGTKEETREGFEYELTLSFEIINDKHLAKASKDRTQLFMDMPETVINEETGKTLRKWSMEGVNPIDDIKKQLETLKTREEIEAYYLTDDIKKYHKNEKVKSLFTNRAIKIETKKES
tara:strand:+ start:1851 stop:2696 length:846 start_codon:yes stop_codon:yes gene_type:complete